MLNVRHVKETTARQLPACLYGIRCEEAVDSRCQSRRRRGYRSWWNGIIFTSGERMGREIDRSVDAQMEREWMST